MRLLNAIYSVGAFFFASSDNKKPGKLFFHGAESDNFQVTSCTSDSIVIADADKISNLEVGSIIVNIGDDEHNGDDDSVCNTCSPLFRKVISRSDDDNDNTIMTTFATFSEVFPQEVYDDDIADVFIEPLFQCQQSIISDGGGGQHHHHHHRHLADLAGFCTGESLVGLIAALLFWVLTPLALVVPAAGTGLVGLLMLASHKSSSNECTRRRRRLESFLLDEQRVLVQQPKDEQQDASATDVSSTFPRTCTDWTATNQFGECLYVDGNVGINGNPSDCFRYNEVQDTNLGFLFNDMIHVSDANIHGGLYDLGEASCVYDYCYSSKFKKEICDINIYKAIVKSNCPNNTQLTTTRTTTTTTKMVETSFPMTLNSLNQNCQLMSLLFYLGVKVFGRDAYISMQSKQNEYQEKALLLS